MDTEKIICAAVKYKDEIFRGHRHCHAIAAMRDKLSYNMTRRDMERINEEQGFMTSENRFVDRKEAFEIAVNGGQLKGLKNFEKGQNLYSEDLY